MSDLKAMLSSSAVLHAERSTLEPILREMFDQVVVYPEESVSGSKATSYVSAAADSDLLVVLIGTDDRPAVEEEVEAALANGRHVAAFELQYLPHKAATSSKIVKTIRESGVYTRSVDSFPQLTSEVRKAVAFFMAVSARTFSVQSDDKSYELFYDWLQEKPRELVLVQNTSSLILGPHRSRYREDNCVKRIEELVTARNGMRLTHIFNEKATRNEILNRNTI